MLKILILSLSFIANLYLGEKDLTPQIVFDLTDHKGYILNNEGKIIESFPILSGQRRVVRYIGRTYFAETPEKSWTAKSLERKGDTITFGKSGRFLRLYDENGRTAYGIHPYRYYEREFNAGNKYVSMGCILVSEENMDKIQTFFKENNSQISVITTKTPELYVREIKFQKLLAMIFTKENRS